MHFTPLEQALKLFDEGMQLSSTCRKELEEAEGKVEDLALLLRRGRHGGRASISIVARRARRLPLQTKAGRCLTPMSNADF